MSQPALECCFFCNRKPQLVQCLPSFEYKIECGDKDHRIVLYHADRKVLGERWNLMVRVYQQGMMVSDFE